MFTQGRRAVNNSTRIFILFLGLQFLNQAKAQNKVSNGWIKSQAMLVSGIDSPLSERERALLDAELADKRIVFLGEGAHWVHQKYDYRLRFLNYLVSKGFKNIGMEMGYSDGARVNEYFHSRDTRDLDRVALYGYKSPSIRPGRDKTACSPTTNAHPDFVKLFRHEERWFYSKLAEKYDLNHFGFDIDTIAGGAYEDLAKMLEPFKHSPPILEVLNRLRFVGGETLFEEILRLEHLQLDLGLDKNREDMESIVGKNLYKKLRLSLRVLIESLNFEKIFDAKPCDKAKMDEWNRDLLAAMTRRERVMFEIIQQKLEELGSDEKIVLMGHNFHLSKDFKSLWFANSQVPELYSPQMWPSIGGFLSTTLKEPTYSIWMIHNQGFQSNIDCPTLECPVENGPNYLGAHLTKAGPVFSLPLKAEPNSEPDSIFRRRMNFSTNGGTYSGIVGANADLIFFVDEVSGLKVRN